VPTLTNFIIYPQLLSIRKGMVTTEYPPMQGGVGRYSANLANSLQKLGLEVFIVCNENGNGDFYGLYPSNAHNSDVILNAIAESKPDIVHIQYEHELYGLVLDPINPGKISTSIDSFYARCKIPIITTFHSAYNFKQWMNLATATTQGKHKINRYMHLYINYCKRLLNYRSFNRLNKQKLAMSQASIVFSQYLSDLICGSNRSSCCDVIYHSAEPTSKIIFRPSKREARDRFSLPQGQRIVLALGYRTAAKGWDIFEKMNIPNGWVVVTNGAENHYNKDNVTIRFNKQNQSSLIDLKKDFITEEDLSFLLYTADATILPYKVCSGSGVMFDALLMGYHLLQATWDFSGNFLQKD
jgi:glycosyltransferase involved in cell wall biosynthesis